MEALYSKLYDKYNKLKTKKFTELDELNKDQEVKFFNCLSEAEEYIQHLKIEMEKLRSQVNDLRNEVASARVSNDELCAKYQRQWIEESQRNKVLSEENEMLKKLQQEGAFSRQKNRNDMELSTPRDARIESRELIDVSSGTTTISKRRRHLESETGNATSRGSGQDDAIPREPTSLNKEGLTGTAHASVQQAECCRRAIAGSGDGLHDNDTANCLFQALVEYLVGMKFSILTQNEGICMSAEHQSSGYSFSLTWVEKAKGKEVELLYNVLSLGTLERTAPRWMKEEIMFSTTMCPIFFERVSRAVKLFS